MNLVQKIVTSQACKVGIGGLAVALVLGFELRTVYADDRPTNPEVKLNTLELLSYQDSGYLFEIIGQNATPPAGFEFPDFDDSGFNIANGAFGAGGGGGVDGGDCPLRSTVLTRWRTNSQLLLRHALEIPEGAVNLRVLVSVDNNLVGAFFNGVPIIPQPILHGNCPIADEFRIDVPSSLVQPGQSLLAFHVQDTSVPTGNESFFDARVLAEVPTDRLDELTDNVGDILESVVPSISLSQVTVSCPTPRPQDATVARARFMVDGTRARGQVIVTQRRGQVLVIEHMLNGENTHTTTVGPQRSLVRVNPDAVPGRARVEATNMAAFPALLGAPRVNSALLECVLRNFGPQTPCAIAVRTATQSCESICLAEKGGEATSCLRIPVDQRSRFCRFLVAAYGRGALACMDGCQIAGREELRSCPAP